MLSHRHFKPSWNQAPPESTFFPLLLSLHWVYRCFFWCVFSVSAANHPAAEWEWAEDGFLLCKLLCFVLKMLGWRDYFEDSYFVELFFFFFFPQFSDLQFGTRKKPDEWVTFSVASERATNVIQLPLNSVEVPMRLLYWKTIDFNGSWIVLQIIIIGKVCAKFWSLLHSHRFENIPFYFSHYSGGGSEREAGSRRARLRRCVSHWPLRSLAADTWWCLSPGPRSSSPRVSKWPQCEFRCIRHRMQPFSRSSSNAFYPCDRRAASRRRRLRKSSGSI